MLLVCQSGMEGRQGADDGGDEVEDEKVIRQGLIVRNGRAGGPNPSDLVSERAGWGHVCPNIGLILPFQVPFRSRLIAPIAR